MSKTRCPNYELPVNLEHWFYLLTYLDIIEMQLSVE